MPRLSAPRKRRKAAATVVCESSPVMCECVKRHQVQRGVFVCVNVTRGVIAGCGRVYHCGWVSAIASTKVRALVRMTGARTPEGKHPTSQAMAPHKAQ